MRRYRHILAAVDFSHISKVVIEQAKELAELHNAHLALLHVVPNLPLAAEPFGEPAGLVVSPEILQQQLANAQQELERLATAAQLPLHVERAVIEGMEVSDSILEFAASKHSNLIVMAHSGKRGFLGLLGSTATSVVKHARCDVLVLREQAEDQILP